MKSDEPIPTSGPVDSGRQVCAEFDTKKFWSSPGNDIAVAESATALRTPKARVVDAVRTRNVIAQIKTTARALIRFPGEVSKERRRA